MNISVYKDIFPIAGVFTIARGSRTEAVVVRVEVEDNGSLGRGECVPYARYGETVESVTEQIASLPAFFDLGSLQDLLPAGAARNAVDCALWDLKAKQQGVPVWQLANLPCPTAEITTYTLSLDSPERMEAQAARNQTRPLLKIKLGGEEDIARLEAVRRGAPKARLIVDANEGWSIDMYRQLAPTLVNLGVELVEQPLAASKDEALLEVERPLPVCADESCHTRSSLPLLKGKYDMINIKLDKNRGTDRGHRPQETCHS